MIQILLIFIAGMVAGAFLPRISAYWQARRGRRAEPAFHFEEPDLSHAATAPVTPENGRRRPRRQTDNVFRPPVGVVAQQKEKKDANLQAILGAFTWAADGKLRAEDVEKMLGVSESTALRYLDELEKDLKVRKEIGPDRKVYYVKLS